MPKRPAFDSRRFLRGALAPGAAYKLNHNDRGEITLKLAILHPGH